jgi:hypothetical protein
MSYECSDEGTYTPNIHNSCTCSHPPEEEKVALEIAAKIASVNWPLDAKIQTAILLIRI